MAGLAGAYDEHGLLLLDSGRGAFYAPPPCLHRLLFASGEVERYKLPAAKKWKLTGGCLAPVLRGDGQSFHLQNGRFVPGAEGNAEFSLAVPAAGELAWSERDGNLIHEKAILPGKPAFLKAAAGGGRLLALTAGDAEVHVLLWNLLPDWEPAERLPDGYSSRAKSRLLEFAECALAGPLLRDGDKAWAERRPAALRRAGHFGRPHSTFAHSATNALRTHHHSEDGFSRTPAVEPDPDRPRDFQLER